MIVAAGSGQRAGGPKQWRLLAGKPLVRWSAESLLAAGARRLVIVRPADAEEAAHNALNGLERWVSVAGGSSRADSVRAGLAALDGPGDEVVLIHDAARPFLRVSMVEALLAALDGAEGVLPALPVADSLKLDAASGLTSTPRDGLLRAQTPQAFRRDQLVAALAGAQDPTDDAAAIEAAGGRVVAVPGDPMLFKLTYPEDFAMAERLAGAARQTRVGQGFDAHRLGEGDGVWLCGIKLPFDQGLIGHSDADVALHALTDAVLGAIAEGDIGIHFPPSDPQWKGAASDRFLQHAVSLLAGKGGRLINIDLTIVCEAPKIGPHRQAMRERLAELTGVPLAQVSVKATTTEKMGFTGRGEGIAAQALAVVETPA
ncbi:MAG: 2C-methyl-D-erythritol 2,4-cyclodiphosphate synthase [Caulobacteraceae bacterium]|nr:2C-methyl-D-erythritol 2,4-cyclodiphosphate synthase [Caulobacteraceae bacterium]